MLDLVRSLVNLQDRRHLCLNMITYIVQIVCSPSSPSPLFSILPINLLNRDFKTFFAHIKTNIALLCGISDGLV